MSPSDFAALLLANDKKRFKIEVLVSWISAITTMGYQDWLQPRTFKSSCGSLYSAPSSPLKNQCVLVGSFTLQMLPADDPLNREDSC